jgi:hypothetical protein
MAGRKKEAGMTWHITSIPIEDQYKACRTATDAFNELSDRIGLVAAIFVVFILINVVFRNRK